MNAMRIREITCKTALSPSALPGLDYSLNPYRGCQHSCAYCYVPNVLKIKRENWGNFVDIKINIPVVLSKELKKRKPGVVGISTVTDPYQPTEKKYELTKFCLEQLLRYDFPICIQTKSSLVVRDIDIISKFSNAEVMMSIATLHEHEKQLLEPYSSSIKKRLDTLREYSNIGIKTSVFFGPVYPTTHLEDIPKIIDAFIDYGATEIMIDTFNFKPGIWENMELRLSSNNKLKDVFKRNLIENDSYNQKLFDTVKHICKKKKVKAVSAF
jgi:DNA repair photolyase